MNVIDLEVEKYDDPVNDHFELFRTAETLFKMIFAPKRLEKMVHRLDLLRMSATEWSEEKHKFVRTWHEGDLKEIVELAKKCSMFVYRDHVAHGDNEVEQLYYDTAWRELQLSLYEAERAARKAKRPVPLSLLTPGTVVEIKVSSDDPMILTVDALYWPEMGKAIATFVEKTQVERGNKYNGFFPKSVSCRINTHWFTKVIKHTPGVPRWASAYVENNESVYAHTQAGSKVGKRKASYAVGFNLAMLIKLHVDRLGVERDYHQYVDIDALVGSYLHAHPVRRTFGEDWSEVMIVDKKRLKRWIRQNVNRHLVSRSDQEARERAAERERAKEYAEDMADDTW